VFYDHCLNCGTPLPPITQPKGIKTYLVPAVVVVFVILVSVFLVIPAVHYSMTGGQALSTAINGVTASPTPAPQYHIDQPARVGDLQVTVTDARAGANQFNAKRFYTVTLALQNFNAGDTYTLSAADFTLTDAGGNYYSSSGIQSQPSYDLLPGTVATVDLVYIVPVNADKLRVLYLFPAATAAPGEGRTEVAFAL
jgi:hypothetical protein